MAEAIVSRFARLLDDFAKDGKLRVFGGEFDKLRKTVSSLQNRVPDAERRSLQEEAIERWLDDLKAAFYDAEDLLEGWKNEVMRPESPSKYEESKAAFYDAEDLLEGWNIEVMRPESPSKYEESKAAFYDAEDLLEGWNIEVMRSESPSKYEESKAAFYDAEDLLEGWNIEVMRPESPSKYEESKQVITSLWPLNELALRPEMRARARDIRYRIEAIAAKGRDFDLRESAEDVRVGRGARDRERSESFVYDEEEIIGREDAKSAIMKFLLDSDTDEQISILPICGESGIGKTALARCLYEDDMVKKHFDLRIWVCVGGDFRSLQRELRNIRGRETTERADDMEQLQKYLLVIDDLRSVYPERWWSLKSLLMGGAQGSKVLITTHHQSVADLMGTTLSYCLEALSENSSFDLLMRMACEEEEETRDSIKLTVGTRIVKKCGGIPLLIRIIGSLLFFKKTEAEWLHFEDEISKFSAGFWDLGSIVELSYIYLPSHLRQCFAFCSLFPKDSVIDKQMLTSLWMAEGFIWPIGDGDQDLEDIAHDYFMDLLRRNFFQDYTKDEFGKVTSCKMHDLMNDLAYRVAGTEYKTIDHSQPLIKERTRHVACDSTLDLSHPIILGVWEGRKETKRN